MKTEMKDKASMNDAGWWMAFVGANTVSIGLMVMLMM